MSEVENVADIVARMAQNANRLREQGPGLAPTMETVKPRALLPDRHPTRDFFIADILDWALKDDRHPVTMAWPPSGIKTFSFTR